MNSPTPSADQLNWAAITPWLKVLESDAFEPGEWVGGESSEPGVMIMPWVAYAADVERFVQSLYDEQVVAGFDWSTWYDNRGHRFADDSEALRSATLEECRMLLVVHIRQDRFVEGHLLQVLESGHMADILRRIRRLTVDRGTAPYRAT